jgi:hypothetical protein
MKTHGRWISDCGLGTQDRPAVARLPLRPAASGPRRAKCAKQTQFAPERYEGQVLYGKRFIVKWRCKGLRQNKANFRRCRVGRGRRDAGRIVRNESNFAGRSGSRRARCAKRSQFPVSGAVRDARLCKTKPICRPDLQEAPPAGRLCETKPIPARQTVARGWESTTVPRPHTRRLEIAFSRRTAILCHVAWDQARPTS